MAGTIPWWAGPPREVEPSVIDYVHMWALRSPGRVFVREGSQDPLPGREGAEAGSGREKCCRSTVAPRASANPLGSSELG